MFRTNINYPRRPYFATFVRPRLTSFDFADPAVRTIVLVLVKLPAVFQDMPLIWPTYSTRQISLRTLLWFVVVLLSRWSSSAAVGIPALVSTTGLRVAVVSRAVPNGFGQLSVLFDELADLRCQPLDCCLLALDCRLLLLEHSE